MKSSILGYNYTARFFGIDGTLLCEFENDRIWINEFE